MGYVSKTLGQDEEIVYKARFNWTYDLAAWFWLFVGASPLLLAAFFISREQPDDWGPALAYIYYSIVPALIGLGYWLSKMIHKWSTEIVVTNARFVMKTGLISRRTAEVNLNKIEEVSLRQTFWGRIFGYGQLTIRGTGVGLLELPELDEPLRLRRKIQSAKMSVANKVE